MPDAPSTSFTWTVPEGEGMSAIPIRFDQRALFGKARPPVVVDLNGYSYRSTIAIMSGETFVPLRRSHREAANIRPGDAVKVTLTLDTAPREVDPPAALAQALDAAALRPAWYRLSYTQKREHAEAVETAKRPETRTKRIAAIVAGLGG